MLERLRLLGHDVVADRVDDLGPLEDARDVLLGAAVPHVRVVEDVVEAAPALVLADDVDGDALLGALGRRRGTRTDCGESDLARHEPIVSVVYPCPMRQSDASARYAERVLESVDDGGAPERIVLWIERKDGGVWAVGRAVNPQHRESDEPRADDYLFEGYELDDALEAANGALEDDVSVLEQDGDSGTRGAVHAQGDRPAARARLVLPRNG